MLGYDYITLDGDAVSPYLERLTASLEILLQDTGSKAVGSVGKMIAFMQHRVPQTLRVNYSSGFPMQDSFASMHALLRYAGDSRSSRLEHQVRELVLQAAGDRDDFASCQEQCERLASVGELKRAQVPRSLSNARLEAKELSLFTYQTTSLNNEHEPHCLWVQYTLKLAKVPSQLSLRDFDESLLMSPSRLRAWSLCNRVTVESLDKETIGPFYFDMTNNVKRFDFVFDELPDASVLQYTDKGLIGSSGGIVKLVCDSAASAEAVQSYGSYASGRLREMLSYADVTYLRVKEEPRDNGTGY